mmetsp:Transcript_20575/g.49836  ORF Transcript_20575/g.49836 Transcript_20575/m.49836 type:complete len:748 (-) Transcript_20575:390-2633(-)
MAFRAGFETQHHDRMGKDLEFSSMDKKGQMREVRSTKNKSWEAATGTFILAEKSDSGIKTPRHLFAYRLIECSTVCWRIGVASAGYDDTLASKDDFFPVHDLWGWWQKLEIGDPPPWCVCVAGGKDEIFAVPGSIIKAGKLKIDVSERKPMKLKVEKKSRFQDGVGRLRLQAGDEIGCVVDMGTKNGDCTLSFFVNGHKLCETLHLATMPGERWVPWVCMGNNRVKIRMLSPSEATWDLPEQQCGKAVEATFLKGKMPFEDAGWLGRKQSGAYVRSWYMLGTEELLFSPNPNLHISILEARDLEAMDLSGLSDPYVTIRVGAEKWTINDKKKDSRWKLEQTKTINQNLDPTFNEQFSIALDDIEGWISLTVWDADTLSAHDPIGEVFIPIKDVFDASSSAEKLKEWQRARLSLSHPKKNDTSSMKLRISCRIGHDAANVVQKKKRFGLSSLVMSGLKKIGRLKLENLSNVRAGVNDRELQADFRSSNGDHTQIVFRVDNKDPDPSGKPGLVMGEKTLAMRDEWLHALNLGVTKRLMAGKARRRAVAMLTDQAEREKTEYGDWNTIVDPSNFHEFGFSRVDRVWKDHPLMSSDKELREGKLMAMEVQFTEVDCITVAEALHGNTWCKTLDLGNYKQAGYIGDAGASALAAALNHNTTIETIILRGNHVGDEGCTEFAEALRYNTTLTKLDLSGCNVTKNGVINMIGTIMGDSYFRPNKTLKILNLELNDIPGMETGKVGNCFIMSSVI